MIEIDKSISKSFYFVSNIRTGTLTIIDGFCNTILKEIVVGSRPFKLALKDSNTLGVACDISNTVSFVNCISGEVKENHIPNNGNLLIDTINKKIFVSNTSEVTIYDINLKVILWIIKGFSAIVDLKLSEDRSKLYVLDTLLKELRIYSTDSYKLINSFKNLGVNSTNILISKDDKVVYISVKNNILRLDIDSKKIIDLFLPSGSLISGMILKDQTLYVANTGLNRIELINLKTHKVEDFILTSRPQPTRLFVTDDNTKLLITNRSQESHGGLDIIDLKSNSLIASILMNRINSEPYDVISMSLPYTYAPPVAITNLQSENQPIRIIAKKIFASYNENLNFPKININLPGDKGLSYIFKKIEFKPGIILENSEFRSRINTTSMVSNFKFVVRVKYIIDYLESNKNNSIDGFFEKPIDVSLDIQKNCELNDVEFKIKTTTKLISNPTILHNVISFGATTLMELKIIGEDEIYITNLKEALEDEEEYFEELPGLSGSIFPEGTVYPF